MSLLSIVTHVSNTARTEKQVRLKAALACNNSTHITAIFTMAIVSDPDSCCAEGESGQLHIQDLF